jgi:hypothetical protein
MSKAPLLMGVFGMLVFSSCFSNESMSLISSPPIEAGKFNPEIEDRCSNLTGSYVLLGKLVSGRVSSPMDLKLQSVLGAPYLRAAYDPANRLYADIFLRSEIHQIEAEIFVGPHMAKWSTQDYVCEQGWLKLSRKTNSGSEGNNTEVNIISYLRKNIAGDLVVCQRVKGRTSNLFGLVWANIDDESWLVFKQVNPKHK